MSIQVPTPSQVNLPGRVALLALATGLGFVAGASAAPLWGTDAATSPPITRQSQPAPPPIASDGAVIRANEARLEPVLHDGQHYVLEFSPERTIVLAASEAGS